MSDFFHSGLDHLKVRLLRSDFGMSDIETIQTPKGFDGELVESQRNINLSNGLCIHLAGNKEGTEVFLFDNVNPDIIHNDYFYETFSLAEMLECFQSFDGEMNRAIKSFFP